MHVLVVAIFSFACLVRAQQNPGGGGHEVIEAKLVGYNKHIRPSGANTTDIDGGPVIIHVNFFLRRLSDIDEDEMHYHAELTFRQQWKDERLAYDPKHVIDSERPYLIYRHSEASEKIWTPDTFFQNAIDVQDYDLMEPNEMVRIHPDGNIIFSKRISLSLAQSYDFGEFPFDSHTLALDISSYAYDEHDIVYKWRDENPIQVRTTGMHDPNFDLVKAVTKRCVGGTFLGRYSCLRAEFEVEREASRTQLFQLFGPSFVLVVISWLPFMISSPSILIRAVIGVSCLITIILQMALIDDDLPSSHEITWAHVWLFTCFAFIVAAQFQLVAYAWLIRIRARRSAAQRNAEQQRRSARVASGSAEGHTNEHSAPLLSGKGDSTEEQLALLSFETIFDLVCLLAFALAFFIFNCYFWTSIAASSEDDDDSAAVAASNDDRSKH